MDDLLFQPIFAASNLLADHLPLDAEPVRHGDLVDPHDGVLPARRVACRPACRPALLLDAVALRPQLGQLVGRVDRSHVRGVGQLGSWESELS